MSLRLRLTLVILAVVAGMGLVNMISFRINSVIELQVADLSRTSSEPIDEATIVGQALEVEGRWDERGWFVAAEIERLARSRRPKMRGTVQALDRAARTLTLYGRTIQANTDTESPS